MTSVNRRRFLAISASAACLATRSQASTTRHWTGTGLGTRMTISLDHPDGERLAAKAFAEVSRLEDIFSLYRTNSALSRLNARGVLENPPFELLECFSLCGSVHRATGGVFDPTVQTLWQLYAASLSEDRLPLDGEIAAARKNVGWDRVEFTAAMVKMPAGTSLTLNGIAQGFVADKVAEMLKREGLTNVLVDTGELAAIGGDWPVMIDAGRLEGPVHLRDQALATSAPFGTVLDGKGKVGHIFDPRTGRPSVPRWRVVSVTSSSAAMADALSTAAILMNEEEVKALFARATSKLVLAEPFQDSWRSK